MHRFQARINSFFSLALAAIASLVNASLFISSHLGDGLAYDSLDIPEEKEGGKGEER